MRPNITLVLFLSMALVSSATIGKSQNTRSVIAAQQPQYDTIIIGRINTTVMTSRETRVMEQAERVMLDDYPIVPLEFYVRNVLVNPKLQGYVAKVVYDQSRYLSFKE